MRELKFRAWDTKWSRWIAPTDLSIRGDGTYDADRRADYMGDVIETTCVGVIIEQYTGLKDKNGVEIYEGDIIGIPGIVALVVGFKDGCFVDTRLSPAAPLDERIGSYAEFGGPEVIGNIHEHGELLK